MFLDLVIKKRQILIKLLFFIFIMFDNPKNNIQALKIYSNNQQIKNENKCGCDNKKSEKVIINNKILDEELVNKIELKIKQLKKNNSEDNLENLQKKYIDENL